MGIYTFNLNCFIFIKFVHLSQVFFSFAALLLFLLSLHRGGGSVPSPLQGELRQHGIVFTEETGTTAAADSAGRKEESSTAVQRRSKEKQDGEQKRSRFAEMWLRQLEPTRGRSRFGFLFEVFWWTFLSIYISIIISHLHIIFLEMNKQWKIENEFLNKCFFVSCSVCKIFLAMNLEPSALKPPSLNSFPFSSNINRYIKWPFKVKV